MRKNSCHAWRCSFLVCCIDLRLNTLFRFNIRTFVPTCSDAFAAQKNVDEAFQLFRATGQYLKRLDCLYDGPLQLLQPSPDTLKDLSGSFKWDKKANSPCASRGDFGVRDFGAHRVHEVSPSDVFVQPLAWKSVSQTERCLLGIIQNWLHFSIPLCAVTFMYVL